MIKENRSIEVTCDRCGLICANDEYFTIDIHGHGAGHGITFAAAIRNCNTNMGKTFGTQKHYCLKCIEKIEKVIRTKGD